MPILNTALTLKDLPPPPPEKTGWPWTEQTEPLPPRMPDDSEWPRISIVTPSYNQGEFIEETIRSVLLQGYPNLEYIIIDGGSTDNSIEIIKKYEPWLAYWVSEPDRGQSNALNKGFRKVTGQLIGWQNSDDFYHPETFKSVLMASLNTEKCEVFYGYVNVINREIPNIINVIKPSKKFDLEEMLPWFKIFNEAIFFRKIVLDEGNYIDEKFHHYMDYDFFWKLIFAGYNFEWVSGIIAYRRLHPNAKSANQHDIAAKELFELYKIAYTHTELPINVRQKILECSRLTCLDHFAKLRLVLFRKNFFDLILMAGLKALDHKIMLKYLLSFLPVDFFKKLNQVKP